MRRRHRISARSRRNFRAPEVAAHMAGQTLVFVLALAVGLLGATIACRADDPANPEPNSAEEKMTQPADVTFDLDATDEGPPPKLAPITVRRGQVIQLNCKSNTVWITIPSQYFSEAGGGSDWAVGREMITFKIDKGFARVRLSEEFPASDDEQRVYYSVLFYDGTKYYYQEDQSPPSMIIPPTGG